MMMMMMMKAHYAADLTCCDGSLYKPHPARASQPSPLDSAADVEDTHTHTHTHKHSGTEDARGLSPDVGSV